jgi:plastocyanin
VGRGLRQVGLACVLVAALALPAAAAGEVTMNDNGFYPSKVSRAAGGSVTWKKTSGYHNVVSTQKMFSSGSPKTDAFTYTRTFSAGVFPYICAVHPQTMRARVRVKPKVSAAPSGAPFTVTWATSATNTGSRFTVQYRVGSGSWKTWLGQTSSRSAVFGKGGTPVRARAGTTYSFRVRSHSGSNASSYSPVVSFRP